MGKLINELNKQVKSKVEKDKADAKDCIEVYEWLKSNTKDGRVWSSDWTPLVNVGFRDRKRVYKLTKMGETLLIGIQFLNGEDY